MTDFQYMISSSEGGMKSAMVKVGDAMRVVPGSHPYWSDILDTLTQGNEEDDLEELERLLDLDRAVTEYLELSERLSFRDGKIEFDGDVVENDLTETLIKLVREDEDASALVNFFENLSTNPSEFSRNGLWRWIADRNLTITEDGNFIAYKGLTRDGKSVHSGTAFVDGVKVEGQIPNEVGTTVTMPRSTVDDASYGYCSTGLHVGTWSFAYGFSRSKVVTVSINPRDVVAVPTESDSQKMRVCRYTVLEEVTRPLDKAVYSAPTANVEENAADNECGCGEVANGEYCYECEPYSY